ncbi:MAG TPA: hypothetical protein VMT35_15935 [Ignavibacteriaceae bacterium]|nr:hypothetical protein [Ignavibacteriaceae bacterium]
MKYWLTRLLVVFALFLLIFAGAYLPEGFNAKSEGENVKLWWKTEKEENVSYFKIQRKTPSNGFSDIATILPKGSNSYYSYIDQATYKASDLIFVYKLLIVDNNGTVSESEEVSASPTLSVPTRTWGSIKAMFR